MRCWVIMGNCGEYSDHCDWVVGAFVAESAAEDYLDKLQAWAREHNVLDGEQDPSRPFRTWGEVEALQCLLDPEMRLHDPVWWEIHETELHGGGAVNV